jgi:hypothetical protein
MPRKEFLIGGCTFELCNGNMIKSGVNTIKLWPNEKATPFGTPGTLTEISERTRLELAAQEFEDDGNSNWLRDRTLKMVNKKMRESEIVNSGEELLLNIELHTLKYPIYIFETEKENIEMKEPNKLKSFFEISKAPHWVMDDEITQQNLSETKHHILSKSLISFIKPKNLSICMRNLLQKIKMKFQRFCQKPHSRR